jgi:hypothetical protein
MDSSNATSSVEPNATTGSRFAVDRQTALSQRCQIA